MIIIWKIRKIKEILSMKIDIAGWKNCALQKEKKTWFVLFCLFGWLVGFLMSSSTIRLYRGRVPRLTSDNFTRCHTWDRGPGGDHDFCLSRSHYTNTDPTSRERATTVGIEPRTSSSGVARSTNWATAPPPSTHTHTHTHTHTFPPPLYVILTKDVGRSLLLLAVIYLKTEKNHDPILY